eukprot:TRINITY_DN794_c0_g1_i1.p2 TRINITY_DN794_c0_g1~~TRINITY_DN794_c0_g1_i1.p2  ORF type:complete len:124 (+),score=31.81 TRINITY_DN794_c0_g1_i1:574-945(+)
MRSIEVCSFVDALAEVASEEEADFTVDGVDVVVADVAGAVGVVADVAGVVIVVNVGDVEDVEDVWCVGDVGDVVDVLDVVEDVCGGNDGLHTCLLGEEVRNEIHFGQKFMALMTFQRRLSKKA